RNSRLVKMDLAENLSIRAAANLARDTRHDTLTGKTALLDDADHGAFLLFHPIFKKENLQGWVFCRFREEDLLKGISFNGITPMQLQVFDGPAMTRETLFFDTNGPIASWQKPNDGPLTVVKGFEANGRT